MQLFEAGIILAVGLGVTHLFKWFATTSEPVSFTEDSVPMSRERRRMLIEQEKYRDQGNP